MNAKILIQGQSMHKLILQNDKKEKFVKKTLLLILKRSRIKNIQKNT